jgi:predicted deacylase
VDTKVNQGKKPEIMITAATHGDELITVEVLITLMNELLSQYGKNDRITKMLDSRTIYFIPVVTPDSFEARSRYVEGEDPNRCYPWPENPKNQPLSVIEALMKFTNAHNFVGSLDMHAYGQLVMYPWGYTATAPASSDVVVMSDLVNDMAKDNQYTAGQISTTIYVAKGNSADYYYWTKKTRAIAVEIGKDKVPSYLKIPSIVNESREMIFKFIESFN